MTPPTRVLWLPAHPSAGSVSMLRHWRELHEAWQTDGDPAVQVACPLGDPPPGHPHAGRLVRAWNKYVSYPRIVARLHDAGTVHVLDHSFAHLLRSVPRGWRRIATVHDLAPLHDAALSEAQRERFIRTVSWLGQADLLLSDSEFTAGVLRSFLKNAPRIEVLPLGVNVAAFARPQPLPAAIRLPPEPRLLSVGSILDRKNLTVLPEILAHVKAQAGAVSLVRAGELLPPALRAAIEQVLGPGRLLECGRTRDEDLVALFQSSAALLFPSTLEGFGLPLLEAMAAGCPVVSSDASSLPEVGGEVARYFSPHDAATAAAHVVQLLREPALRTRLIAQGRERAERFSWAQHARRLAAFYREGTDAPAGLRPSTMSDGSRRR